LDLSKMITRFVHLKKPYNAPRIDVHPRTQTTPPILKACQLLDIFRKIRSW
jgi:hypothetical protein